jgi:probable rRNA maturation factor
MSPPASIPDDIPLLFSPSIPVQKTGRIRKSELRDFLQEVTRCVTKGRVISCLITDDAELRRMNKQYRRQDYATDVLSFPAGDQNDFSRSTAGDLAISIDRARAQAMEHGHAIDIELRILMLHGALHLAGMDHEQDAGEMARAETRWRKKLGLPSGLIERSGASK